MEDGIKAKQEKLVEVREEHGLKKSEETYKDRANARPQAVIKPQESARGGSPFAFSSYPTAYSGGGAIFAPRNRISQSKNRFSTVSASENLQDFSGNWWGGRRRRIPWICGFG